MTADKAFDTFSKYGGIIAYIEASGGAETFTNPEVQREWDALVRFLDNEISPRCEKIIELLAKELDNTPD